MKSSKTHRLLTLWQQGEAIENQVDKEKYIELQLTPVLFKKSIKYYSLVENYPYTSPMLFELTFKNLSEIQASFMSVIPVFTPNEGYKYDLTVSAFSRISVRYHWKKVSDGMSLRVELRDYITGQTLAQPPTYTSLLGKISVRVYYFNPQVWHEIQHSTK